MNPAESDDQLEREFDAAMLEGYYVAGRELGYWAHYYLRKVRNVGGLRTAHDLLKQPGTTDGYARLREAGRSDLTLEALVLQPRFQRLFSEAELATARERLGHFDAVGLPPELEPSSDLTALFDEANLAPPSTRVSTFRERLASFGLPAITASLDSVKRGGSPGLAIAVIESVAKLDRQRASNALWSLRQSVSGWDGPIDDALARTKASQ